ncbi:MAG TPA: PKD domain-containing protein [Patescibacteria group bacterium]|nr:PKD domain-containing protein [Patescibacteria group bacterium]
MSRSVRLWIGLVVVSLLAATVPAVTLGAPPNNDAFSAATTIGSLPFAADPALTEATVEPDEPGSCQSPPAASVWYSYHAGSSGFVRVALEGETKWLVRVAVFRVDGAGITGLTEVFCTPTDLTDFLFEASVGTTYAIQLATANPDSAAAHLDISAPTPPANDAFARATRITSVPFTADTEDLTAAGVEPNEPTDCLAGDRTAWYDFVAPADATVNLTYEAAGVAQLAVFQGDAIDQLTLLDCGPLSGEGRVSLSVHNGSTYHLRMSLAENFAFQYGVRLDIAAAPPPTSFFHWVPSSPIPGEDVRFVDDSEDVAGIGIVSWHWRFNDGSTADGPSATHRYRKDGAYPVNLDIRTADGRTAALTRSVVVKTHDVRIDRFAVPTSVKVGRTFKISLDVSSRHDAEQVVILLYRTGPTGEVEVAVVGGSVPKAGRGRRATFVFQDRLTAADAASGSVTYRVVVELFDEGRDIDPSNNAASSPPVKVKR